jgi:bacterioferritin
VSFPSHKSILKENQAKLQGEGSEKGKFSKIKEKPRPWPAISDCDSGFDGTFGSPLAPGIFWLQAAPASCRIAGMKGNPKVIEQLNRALREELTAINQYFVHAEMCENWGYERLAKFIKKQSIDEMKHAESLMERIFFLDGTPSMESLALSIGANVKVQIESDLKLELGAIAMYNEAARLATDEKDNGSRDLFIKLLKDEEKHADWLETQLHQIAEIGYERYLAKQAGDDD